MQHMGSAFYVLDMCPVSLTGAQSVISEIIAFTVFSLESVKAPRQFLKEGFWN